MVGGNGERRTLRLVAQYADACNFLVLEPEQIRAKLAILRAHCDDLGRDPSEIEITARDEIDLELIGREVIPQLGQPAAA